VDAIAAREGRTIKAIVERALAAYVERANEATK
jgi:predicted transcriptional regulator